ncbi:MAG: hypothetical protein HYX42_16425 [Polaromonas sp.]|uniref:hypothetical protein n=1 Tax=Polaromonas sp. TaxID=1869339 RepID=UPI0025CDAC37|nr:hypothetical protein [Polaromonas sp.]MBI2727829.1 hypothetical protein [Polaromonas sp.]
MSLLSRYLTNAYSAELSKRVTPNGFRLADVIRSGRRYPDSLIGIYAPDFQSYGVFHELFDHIVESFQAPSLTHRTDLACINPAAVVSTRIRVARNLAGHVFPAGMSKAERIRVEEKITHACRSLAPHFDGSTAQFGDIPASQLDAMISERLAFGPHDKYMAAAGIHADWPAGRSVFNTHNRQLSIWINEEDHLRVALVLPGASAAACHALMRQVMSLLAAQLDFCEDPQLGYLTSCPSNVGCAMRVSFRVDLRLDTSQQAPLERLEAAGLIQVRSAQGEHSPRAGGLVDVSFGNRVGISETQMLRDMELLLAMQKLPA